MLTFIIAYLLGGITFLPLVAVCVYLLFADQLLPAEGVSIEATGGEVGLKRAGDEEPIFSTPEKNKFDRRPSNHEGDVAAGYFAVTREWVPGGVNGKPPERPTPGGQSPTESPSVYQSMYRSIFDRKSQAAQSVSNNAKGRNVFFVVLRHGHLMLYDDEDQLEVRHVISLGHHVVSIYSGEDGAEIPEGELFIKRNAICLSRKLPNYNSEDGPSVKKSRALSKPFFMFSENCSDKEDFYFALVKNQELSPDDAGINTSPLLFEPLHIIHLIQRLHSSEEHLQTRWLNALGGRLFLSMYKTAEIHDFIRAKITKKIARVKKPGFLSDIVIQKIDMGEGLPYITHPKLNDLSVDGVLNAEANLYYTGNFRIEIATVATINLGSRFKAREVSLVLAVVLKKLEGTILLKIKAPPSNRIWISFAEPPKMELSIEPIVSSRQITYGVILRAIESRIREVMAETVVLPNWDDSPFAKTGGEPFRGGLWESMSAETAEKRGTQTTSGSVAEAEKEMNATEDSDKEKEKEKDKEDKGKDKDKNKEKEKSSISLGDVNEKSQSMPTLLQPTSPTRPRARRAASGTENSKDDAASSSVEVRPDGTRKKRRSSSATASSAAPVVAMTNVNASAEKPPGRPDTDRSDAISALSIQGASPPSTTVPEGKAVPTIATDTNHVDSETVLDESLFESPGMTPASTSSTTRSQMSGISSAFGALANKRSMESVNSNNSQKPGDKAANAIAAIGTAGAFVKQWVITKKKERDASRAATPTTPVPPAGLPPPPAGTPPKPYPQAGPPAISPDVLRDRINGIGPSTQRRLPPAEIPLPPAPRPIEPMAIPKRKPLPPPLLPKRDNDKRPVPPPPLPPREDGSDNGLMVVEAPNTQNSTPVIEIDDPFSYDDDEIPTVIPTDDDPMAASNATLTAALYRGGSGGGGDGHESDASGSYQGSVGSFDGKDVALPASLSSSPRPKLASRHGSRASSNKSVSSMERPTPKNDDDVHPRSWEEAEALHLRKRVTSEYTGEEG